jgi:hypothetical protein
MSYYINPIEEDHCLFLSFEAEVPAVEAESVRQGVKALLGDRRWNRIVLDATQMQGYPTTWELFAFSESLCWDLPQDAWIALVARPDQARHAQFLENIARSRGVMLTCFTDEGDASNWVKMAPAALNRGNLQFIS